MLNQKNSKMKIKQEALISDLVARTHKSIAAIESLKDKSNNELNWKENSESWSILECVEHLNIYGYFYLPEIENQLKKANTKSNLFFKSGLLGNYFAKSLLPKEKLNKMKTFQDKNPIGSDLDKNVLTIFLEQQHKILALLEVSKSVNLTKIKTAISISKWIKLRLGDTFRVVIYHNDRHLVQIKNIMNVMRKV